MIESQGWAGLNVLTFGAERLGGYRPTRRGDAGGSELILDARGVIAADLGGPPGGEVVGVQIDGGPLVFRKLDDCRILTG